MARTRINLEQIRNASFYDDTLNVASGWSGAGTIEEDLHAVISQIKTITGQANWYDAPQATIAELAAASGQAQYIGFKHRKYYEATGNINAGTEIVIPNGALYTQDADGRNLEVDLNGVTQIPTVDYTENSASGVTFTFKLNNKDRVEFRVHK